MEDYLGKYVLLFFYPLDFTFVCPTEICEINDRAQEFEAIGVQTIGVSVDSHFSHIEFTKKTKKQGGIGPVSIPLISD